MNTKTVRVIKPESFLYLIKYIVEAGRNEMKRSNKNGAQQWCFLA